LRRPATVSTDQHVSSQLIVWRLLPPPPRLSIGKSWCHCSMRHLIFGDCLRLAEAGAMARMKDRCAI
jgi:hypothetical protein